MESTVNALIKKLTATKGHRSRSAVRDRIRALGPSAASELVSQLCHPDDFTRWDVVNLLGEWATNDTAEAVVAFALAEDEVHARWRSFWAVTRFERHRTLPLLLKALGHESEVFRWRAALILSMLGRWDAGPVLVRGLRSVDAWVQWEGLSGIRSLRYTPAVRSVARFLERGISPELRREAVLTMGALGTPLAVRLLEKALADDDPQIRWRAGMGLARQGKKHEAALRQQLKHEKNQEVIRQLESDLKRLT